MGKDLTILDIKKFRHTMLDMLEFKAAFNWMKKHEKVCTVASSWKPGSRFAPDVMISQSSASGIGTNTVVSCPACKMQYDVTNYGSW